MVNLLKKVVWINLIALIALLGGFVLFMMGRTDISIIFTITGILIYAGLKTFKLTE